MIEEAVKEHFRTSFEFKEIAIGLLSRFYPWKSSQLKTNYRILDWEKVTANQNIEWSIDLIEEWSEKIHWDSLWQIKTVELDYEFLKKNEPRIRFGSLSIRNIAWSNRILDDFYDQLNFSRLSRLQILASQRNILKYGDRYDWKVFSENPHLPFSEELIDQFYDKWHWSSLCTNKNFPPSKHFLNKYKNDIDWSSLSRNPSMYSFILAFPDEYPWEWRYVARNPNLILGKGILHFFIARFKKEAIAAKLPPGIVTTKGALTVFLIDYIHSPNRNNDFLTDEKVRPLLPYKEMLRLYPDLLSQEELVKHFDFDSYEKYLPGRLLKYLPIDFIETHKDFFFKKRWIIFRTLPLPRTFLEHHISDDDWFQLAFNEKIDWDVPFILSNYHHFKSHYGITQNKKVYNAMFGSASNEEIEEFLKMY